ncbi:MarR family transcriptional regulator [Miniimonas arenae]|uniref:MarR family transcriptional regulator n=2 Tax=Miniimonas arenae TaxID=676201 RepID=A0A5C5BDB2_9MICO|nr:MarR family transcriptional regulator [Miniimonas arenae]
MTDLADAVVAPPAADPSAVAAPAGTAAPAGPARRDEEPRWLSPVERAAWLRLLAVVELLPGVLDTQLRKDSGFSHFEYQTLAMLSEAPERTLRMTALAERTNATLPRLSHVVTRLAERGLVERAACPTDGRATNVILTDDGWAAVVGAAPGHVRTAREAVLDALSPAQVAALGEIAAQILTRLDPEGRMTDPGA